MFMTPKKIYTYANAILFMFAATSFSSCLAKTESESTKEDVAVKKTMPGKKDTWQRFYAVDRPRAFENYYCVSACKDGVVVASRTPDGQIFLSINGKIVWWNKYADQKRNEPSVLVNFSAGAVTDWDISYTGGNIFPQTSIKGTLYGICSADAIKNPKNKRLYTFEKGNGGGYYWKLDESLTKTPQMVCAARDGSVVVLCDDGPHQKADDGSWNTLGTIKDLKQIAIGNKNAIFALSAKNEVLVWKDDAWTPLQTKNPKSNIRHIAVNPDGVLYCTDETGKASYFSDSQAWVLLPKISNAQQITVMDKEYCWTSQPYGNAIMKNSNDLLGKTFKTGEVAILGTGALAASIAGSVGALGIGASAIGVAGIAAAAGTASSVGFATIGTTSFTTLLIVPGAVPTGLVGLALAPTALIVGSAIAIPVITIGTLLAAALFGPIIFLSRPHCNKILVHNSNAPANAPDETAPEVAGTKEITPEEVIPEEML